MYHLIVIIALFNYVYEDSDSLIVYDDSISRCGYHTYNIKIHLSNAHISITPWSGMADSTGWLTLQAPSVTCQSNSRFHGPGRGYWGGDSSHGDGYGPGAGGEGGISGGGGGGAGYGGAGGNGGDYYPGSGGNTYGDPGDTLIDIGSGGGAGQYVNTIDGYGGNGGGLIRVRGSYVFIDSTDFILNGSPGEQGIIGFEGGGGGSGGGILVRSDTAIIHHALLSVCGGDGAGSAWGGGGGGGGGRIKIFYTDLLDTLICLCSVPGGAGGQGYQGSNGEPGGSGTVHIEQLVSIREYAIPSPLFTVLHGNPVRNSITVHCPDHPAQLRIYNIGGRQIQNHALSRSITTLPIQGLPAGVYFLSIDHYPQMYTKIVILK